MSVPSYPMYSTLEEKVGAYNAFFQSNSRTLIVIGPGGSGKSYALTQAKVPTNTIVFAEPYAAVPVPHFALTTEEYGLRTVYHLLEGSDEVLVKELQRKYEAHVIRFK
jgi:hypothetical protein